MRSIFEGLIWVAWASAIGYRFFQLLMILIAAVAMGLDAAWVVILITG